MPRYRYTCQECNDERVVFHLYDEVPHVECEKCDNIESMIKMITTPYYPKKEINRGKVGDITKEFIQKNREILEEEKLKAKEDTYDPS